MIKQILFFSFIALSIAGCATKVPQKSHHRVDGRIYKVIDVKTGVASYYAKRYQGRATASGEIYYNDKLTAAHKTLPFGTKVRVTLLSSGDSVVVKINDRGANVRGRIIDLSFKAAKEIGLVRKGIAKVSMEILE